MSRLSLLLLLAIVVGPATQSYAGQSLSPMFPPDIDYGPGLLKRLDEPPLWSFFDSKRYRERIRFSIQGINRLKVVIRIDVGRSGSGNGTLVTLYNEKNGSKTIERRSFFVSRAKTRDFDALVGRVGLWRQPRQGWSMSEDDICLDGEEMLFERIDLNGYRAAAANAQCTAPGDLLLVAQRIIELAGERRALELLR